MTAILIVFAAAVAAVITRLAYGAILSARDFEQSEQAWANAHNQVIPARPPRLRPVRPTRLQRV